MNDLEDQFILFVSGLAAGLLLSMLISALG